MAASMPRSGAIREFIRDYYGSSRWEKLAFIPPFIILFMELFLLVYDLNHDVDFIVIEFTVILVVISLFEIIIVGKEIHEHTHESDYREELAILLDDFIARSRYKSVKNILHSFINAYPQYRVYRSDIYRITCQILAVHKEKDLEEEIIKKLRLYTRDKADLPEDEIFARFMDRYPKYHIHPDKVSELINKVLEEKHPN